MSKAEKIAEPSMDEILASIRKIIAEEPVPAKAPTQGIPERRVAPEAPAVRAPAKVAPVAAVGAAPQPKTELSPVAKVVTEATAPLSGAVSDKATTRVNHALLDDDLDDLVEDGLPVVGFASEAKASPVSDAGPAQPTMSQPKAAPSKPDATLTGAAIAKPIANGPAALDVHLARTFAVPAAGASPAVDLAAPKGPAPTSFTASVIPAPLSSAPAPAPQAKAPAPAPAPAAALAIAIGKAPAVQEPAVPAKMDAPIAAPPTETRASESVSPEIKKDAAPLSPMSNAAKTAATALEVLAAGLGAPSKVSVPKANGAESVAKSSPSPVATAAPIAPAVSAPVTVEAPMAPAAQTAAPDVVVAVEAVAPAKAAEASVAPPIAAPVRTMEDTVAELLRPMLREWLDSNMPRIVEKALRIETAGSQKSNGAKPQTKN